MISRRDIHFLTAYLILLVALFNALLFHPGSIPGNFGDIYLYHFPLRHLVTSTLQEGRLPLWNPYIFAGTPLAANPQAVLFYPLSLLHYLLPLNYALGLDAFFHVFLAGSGAYLLLRLWDLDSGGAWALSISYSLSPFLICRLAQGVPTHLAALSWVPWVWLAAERNSPLLLGATFSIQILSGHPQFSLINGLGLLLYQLVRRPLNIPSLAIGGAIAFLLGAVQVFPTLEFLAHSVRTHWSSQYALGYSFKAAYLLTLLLPNHFGNPLRPDFTGFPSSFFEMLLLYIGLIPLFLGVAALAASAFSVSRGRGNRLAVSPFEAAPWLIGAGLFFALGQNNPLYAPVERLFHFDFLRVPARFSFLVLWGLWLAAANGWVIFLRNFLRRPIWRMAVAAGIVIDLGLRCAPWIYAQNPHDFLAPNAQLLDFLRNSSREGFVAPSEGVDFRIATSPDAPSADKSMLYRIPNATGYEAFYLADIAYYTSRSENAPSADGSRTYILKWRTPEMSRLGVRYYVSLAPIGGSSPVFHGKDLYVYENSAALPLIQTYPERSATSPLAKEDRFSAPPSPYRMINPEHWIAQGTGNATVLLSQATYPGWKAWINGVSAPVHRTEGFFPSVEISADRNRDWTVHFRFVPEIWLISLWISLATLSTLSLIAARQAKSLGLL